MSAAGRGRAYVLVFAVAVALVAGAVGMAGVALAGRPSDSSAGAHVAAGVRRSPVRTACGTASRRVGTRGHVRTVRFRACVRVAKFISFSAAVQQSTGRSSNWSRVRRLQVVGDDEPALGLSGGRVRIPSNVKRRLALPGMAPFGARDRAHAAAGGVLVRTVDLGANPSGGIAQSGLSLSDMQSAAETSVAVAGDVVLYTANNLLHATKTARAAAGGAAYSADGGATFTELDTGSVFNTPPAQTSSCAPYCDQVVIYDPYANVFVWVVQGWKTASKDDTIWIGWATPSRLAAAGAKAWRYIAVSSKALFGSGGYIDQPRLGMTPRYLYLSFNLPSGMIMRISHAALSRSVKTRRRIVLSPQLVTGGSGVYDPNCACTAAAQLRVAQAVTTGGLRVSTHGESRGYFVGRVAGDSSAVAVASIADDSNALETSLVNVWSIGSGGNVPAETSATNLNPAGAWSSPTKSGADWLYRQSADNKGSGGTTSVTGVTMAGDGTLWAAWTESRDVLCPTDGTKVVDFSNPPGANDTHDCPQNPTIPILPAGTLIRAHTYPQPHIGLVQLVPQRVDFPLLGQHSAISYAVASGQELVNSGYALALPDLATDASGEVAMSFYGGGGAFDVNHAVGFVSAGADVFRNDATSNDFTGDTNNEYGDYQTVRADSAPFGDCLVSASVVTKAPQQNHLVLSFFSRSGTACPKARSTKPRLPTRSSTSLALRSLDAVMSYTPGQTAHLEADLSPHGVGDTVTFLLTSPGGTQTQFTNGVDTLGRSRAQLVLSQPGSWKIQAVYGGAATRYSSASTILTLTVASPTGGSSSVGLNCPQTANPGDGLTVTAQLTPALAGASIDLSASGPSAIAPLTTATDATGLVYYSFNVGNPGTYTIRAQWTGDVTHTGSSTTCTIVVLTPTTTTISCPAAPLMPLAAAFISGTVTPATNGTPVAISYTAPAGSGGTSTTDHVTTDNTGYFADTFGEDASGKWTVTATFPGDASRGSSSASCTFTVLGG